MREAIGGAMTLEIIIVFLILVNSYLAFSVNYTRAFRVKNAIIDLIEANEGYPAGLQALDCAQAGDTNDFRNRMCSVIKQYGYNASEFANSCGNNPNTVALAEGVCIIPHANITQGTANNKYKGVYYTVKTYISIDLPIIRDILPFTSSIFNITGDTNIIYSSGHANILFP